MAKKSFIEFADVLMVFFIALLLAAVIIPSMYFGEKPGNEREAIAALRIIKKGQDIFSTGLEPVDFVGTLRGLRPIISVEKRMEPLFTGSYEGYTFDLGRVQGQPVPQWLADGNFLLARLADRNETVFLMRNANLTAKEAFSALLTRRSGDENLSLTRFTPYANIPIVRFSETGSVMVGQADLAEYGLLPEVDANLTVAVSPVADMNAVMDMNVAADMNAPLVIESPYADFKAELEAVLANPAPLQDYLDTNMTVLGITTWSAAAWPLEFGSSGDRSFYIDETGIVRGKIIEGKRGGFEMSRLE